MLRATLEPLSAAAARDRIDHEVAAGLPLDAASLELLRAGVTVPAGTAILTWIEAGNLARRGDAAAALALIGHAIAENPDAIPLGAAGRGARGVCQRSGAAGGGARSVAARRSGAPGRGRAGAGARARDRGAGETRRRPTRSRRAARCRPRSRRRRARRCSGRSRRRTRARGGTPTRPRRWPTAPRCGRRARSRRR